MLELLDISRDEDAEVNDCEDADGESKSSSSSSRIPRRLKAPAK